MGLTTEFDDVQIMLDHFTSQYYYGPIAEIALPTFFQAGVSSCKVLGDGEVYSPIPYVVAIYRLVMNNGISFGYKFQGVEIRNND